MSRHPIRISSRNYLQISLQHVQEGPVSILACDDIRRHFSRHVILPALDQQLSPSLMDITETPIDITTDCSAKSKLRFDGLVAGCLAGNGARSSQPRTV